MNDREDKESVLFELVEEGEVIIIFEKDNEIEKVESIENKKRKKRKRKSKKL